MGPRVHDMELKDVVDIILQFSIRAGAYPFEAARIRATSTSGACGRT